MDPAGKRIGHYRIEEVLGSGGMGTVYRAWDEVLERWVALKRIRAGKADSPESRERFRREARAAAALSHPAIVEVYELLEEDGADSIVMELVEGRSLTSILLDGPMDPARAAAIGRQIAEGLAEAHAHGIVHRDLKAENILVTPGGRVKILDFGLAKRLDSAEERLTRDGTVMGTSRAMSPEQALGRPVDARSDLFSLGSLLYEMLSGKHPFQGNSPVETMHRVVHHTPEPLARVAPDVPADLALLVDALLEKDPANRPASAEEVAMALGAAGRSTGTMTVSAESLARATMGIRRRRRRRVLAITAAAVAAAALVAGAALWLRSRRPVPPRLVVVTAPEVEGPAEAVPPGAPGIVRVALLQAVASSHGLATPDPASLKGVSGPPSALVRATGASEALASTLVREGGVLRLTVRRLDASGRLLWTATAPAPADDPGALAGVAHALAARAYPGAIPRRLDVALDAFARYARLAAMRWDPEPGLTRRALLEKVGELGTREPGFLEPQLLAAELATYLYRVNRDPALLERARSAVARAMALAPDDPRTLARGVDVALAAGDTGRAGKRLERLEEIAPGSPMALFRRGALLGREGRWAEAAALYRRAARAYPSWLAYWRLGNALRQSGRYGEARRALERALERAPDNRFCLAVLGELELLHGDVNRAATLFGKLAAAYPSAVYASNLGLAHLLAGDLDAAEAAFGRAVALAPDDPLSRLNLADCLELAGRSAEAAAAYRRVLEITAGAAEDGDPEALQARAQALAHLGRGAEAIAVAQQLLARDPENTDALLTAAITYAVAGERLSARAALDRALAHGLSRRWLELPWLRELARPEPARG